MWRLRKNVFKKQSAALLADSTGAGRATLTGMNAVREFHIITKGLVREKAGPENPNDVLKAVLQELAVVDGLGFNCDLMVADEVFSGDVVTTKASR